MKIPGFGPDSPAARAWRSLEDRVPLLKRLDFARQSAAYLIAFAIVGLVTFIQISSTPQFCGTCHIMKPYYASWKHSKHNKIACVECHISPGITAEVRKKFEALSMVAKYFTGTWGTKPWAEVSDEACLRCHQRRLLEGKVQFHDVTFDHRPHLTESRRGLRLRCTSCHSQIVQGTHLTVTVSTCALCHFKDQGANEGLGRCRKCHEVPDRVVTAGGMAFDHSQVAKLDMACQSCHGNVVRGTGEVPKERCYTCHNQPERIAKYGDKLFLHQMHVTKHKVDCQVCHSQIEHGKVSPSEVQIATKVTNPCQTCHGLGHSPQEQLYAGIGARGVPVTPSPMFVTGVNCQGCHNPAFVPAGATARPAAMEATGPHSAPAGELACMSCHGPRYRAIFQGWEKGVEERTSALRRDMEASVGAMGVEAPQAWEDARHNFTLVSKGRGVHNINYAYMVLDKAFDQLNDARHERGLSTLPRPWSSIPSSPCLSCHLGIESQGGTFGDRAFAHGPHLIRAKLECEKCHRKHAERPAVEVVRFGPDGCTSCHHQNMAQASFKDCSNCHGDISRNTFPSYKGAFSHRQHAKIGEECGSCHKMASGDPRPAKARCEGCHN